MSDPRPFHVALLRGLVIPAHPLALTAGRKLDERRQRALSRYYLAAGAGGLAVGVHTTQFAIREPRHGLYRPVLEIAGEEMDRFDAASHARSERSDGPVRIAGICGKIGQAAREAELARDLRYHAGLLSLGALKEDSEDELIAHVRAVADIIPIVGFYLQPAVGGRILPYSFWRRFAETPNVVAIKIAPFNRYQTLDVVRAVAESGRDDVALYTGNDDNIVMDLVTPLRFGGRELRIVGGLLGQWACWTKRAAELLEECKSVGRALSRACEQSSHPRPSAANPPGEAGLRTNPAGAPGLRELLRKSIEVTDANAAFFDAANGFSGCIAGIHEVLRRQGLLAGAWCLDENEALSPGQAEEIDRVYQAYPHLNDDAFVREHVDEWLR